MSAHVYYCITNELVDRNGSGRGTSLVIGFCIVDGVLSRYDLIIPCVLELYYMEFKQNTDKKHTTSSK